MADPLRQPIIRELMADGWTFTITSKNHLKGTHPDATGHLVVAGSPSDRRAAQNMRSKAKRLLQNRRAS